MPPEKCTEVEVFGKRPNHLEVIYFIFGMLSGRNKAAELLELPKKEIRSF